MLRTPGRLPVTNRRKVGMTSGHHGPYGQGYTRATMARTEGCQLARASQSLKTRRSPDRSLARASVEWESIVMAHQNVAVNTWPGLVHTARHTMGVDWTRSSQPNLREDDYHGVVHDWGEVVPR